MVLPEPGIWDHLVGAATRVDLPTDARSMEDHVPRQLAIQSDDDLRPREREKYPGFFLAPARAPAGQLHPEAEGQGSLGNVVSCDTEQREKGREWI